MPIGDCDSRGSRPIPEPTKHDRYNASPKGRARVNRYEGTAKAMLRKARYDAKRRGTV